MYRHVYLNLLQGSHKWFKTIYYFLNVNKCDVTSLIFIYFVILKIHLNSVKLIISF